MSVFKCKMCGGALEIQNNETVATCEYCGTQQTLPRLDDDRRANLYDRANHFRRANEFDKAAGIYEQILNEDSADAEAYWSLVLCRYGIEYVEDPATHRRVSTVNRAQFTSIFDDADYQAALQYADAGQRTVYEEEARTINEIQKGILAISQKEEPFDVFICYKETDSNGRRTPDSVLANDLYHQLTQEGFKVFFSRITLEDKLGTAYEPYIFAALNSAKVMVALGTKPEYFNAVWVKNEWSRYLALIKSGAHKALIPAYKDMDPYDLPEEFSHLQAQDMSKLGFMQDLIRGIQKLMQVQAGPSVVQPSATVIAPETGTASLLRRAFLFLEDGDWHSADEYCEKVLDLAPECGEAYLGKLMAELGVSQKDALADCKEPFDEKSNYQKILRFGDTGLQNAVKGYVEHIKIRIENERSEAIYQEALGEMASASKEASEFRYQNTAQLFESIHSYKDAASLAEECRERAENARKDSILRRAKNEMYGDLYSRYDTALRLLKSIPGWKDADAQAFDCQKKMDELKEKEEKLRLERERQRERVHEKRERRENRMRKIVAIMVSVGGIVLAVAILLNSAIIPNLKYKDAIALLDKGDWEQAYSILAELGGYKDAALQVQNIKKDVWRNSQAGDYINFGTYEQDNDTTNGREEIEWLVLEVDNNKILVTSKYGLDCQPYSREKEEATWETCTLREWLNDEFINAAFLEEERMLIPVTTVSADKNSGYATNPGNTTQDKVFLLSIDEVNRYFASDETRLCQPTEYAVANGAWKGDSGNCWWWLRSPGNAQSYAADVSTVGRVGGSGNYILNGGGTVRPALWIDLNS